MYSYISSSYLQLMYPASIDYSNNLIEGSLSESFSLINGALNPAIKTPVVGDNGESPSILKNVQVRLCQYILNNSDNGYTEENQNLFDRTMDFIKGVKNEDLSISETMLFKKEIGWSIIDNNNINGKIFVKGNSPLLETVFNVCCASGGYVADAGFEIKRSDKFSIYTTHTGSYDWETLYTGSDVYIRFDGQFTSGSKFTILGNPDTNVIESYKPTIQQSTIYFP